jgi:hypothetical protein
MDNTLKAILILYSPIVFTIFGLLAVITSKKDYKTGIPAKWFNIISTNIPITNKNLAKLFLSFSFILPALVFYVFFLDITWFYPKKMDIKVHYSDEQGLIDLVEEINIDKIGNIPIVMKDKDSRMQYFIDGDTIINDYLHYDNYYTDVVVNRTHKLVTSGEAVFEVTKTEGIHTYQIVNSNGELEHEKFLRDETQKLRSTFFHMESGYDKIKVSKLEHVFRKVITPEFRQYLITDGNVKEMLDHTLYGVTVLYPFPIPSHSNTLYLFEKDGKLIPIGYAVYY